MLHIDSGQWKYIDENEHRNIAASGSLIKLYDLCLKAAFKSKYKMEHASITGYLKVISDSGEGSPCVVLLMETRLEVSDNIIYSRSSNSCFAAIFWEVV